MGKTLAVQALRQRDYFVRSLPSRGRRGRAPLRGCSGCRRKAGPSGGPGSRSRKRMVTPPRGGRSVQLFLGSGTLRSRDKVSSVAPTLFPAGLAGVTAVDLALGHDQVRRAWGGEAVAGRRRKLGRLPSGAALGPRRRCRGEDPGRCCTLAELPAEPFGTGRGAPSCRGRTRESRCGLGVNWPSPRAWGPGVVVRAKDATGQPPAVSRAVTGTDINTVSSSFTLFCVRGVVRTKEKCFHLRCPVSETAKFYRAVCFNFSRSI